IAGTVRMDRGDVVALRVKATDVVHAISYTVYTNRGRFAIYNLPTSEYQVRSIEPDYESPVVRVMLAAGANEKVDLALRRVDPSEPAVELADYDTLYPPGPGRDLLERHAFGFHGPYFHRMPKKTRAGWASAVNRMFNVPGQWPQPSWTNPAS